MSHDSSKALDSEQFEMNSFYKFQSQQVVLTVVYPKD